MKLDALLSTIILVSFLVTIIMAVGSYVAYKLREARRPHSDPGTALEPGRGAPLLPGQSAYFEQIGPADLASTNATRRA